MTDDGWMAEALALARAAGARGDRHRLQPARLLRQLLELHNAELGLAAQLRQDGSVLRPRRFVQRRRRIVGR